jgi:hypothetical protein
MGGFANNAPIVTDGLVFYVDAGNGLSYPGSGTTWYNLVGSNNGTFPNGHTYSSDNGGAIVFDGTNEHVVLDQTISLTDFTITAAFKITSYGSNWAMFFGNTDSDNFVASWDRTLLRVQDDSSFNSDLAYTTDLLNVVHFLQVTQSGNTNTWYLDGQNIGTSTNSNYAGISITRMVFYAPGNALGVWGGNYYMASIYNRALSASEITQNYNALKNRFV